MTTRTKAYLTYALNVEGDLVHIDSVANGNECGCFCPHCKSDLCAKNGGTGEKMVHHFAHLSGADCEGAIESALHKMAKNVMKETLCIQLPDSANGKRGDLLKLDRVEVEFYDKDTRLRPDCIGYYGNNVIWIELKRTHAVDAKKKGKIISAKIDCVELDLNGCDLDPEAVRRFITEETERRIWIRDTSAKPRQASVGSHYDPYSDRYNDEYENRRVQRVFAKDENGNLINLLNDEVDMNEHSYYCLACGKELTIDADESGAFSFVHLDASVRCEDNLYLHEAAKDIIQCKFNAFDKFEILAPQHLICEAKDNCIFYQREKCSTDKGILYNLKEHGYTECLRDIKLQEFRYKCDLVIKRKDNFKNAIIISINAGDCHVDVETEEYRIIEIEVMNEKGLFDLLDAPIDKSRSTFMNFKRDNSKTSPRSEMDREILKFSLFSSGKYHLDYIPCPKVDEQKYTTVMEYLFVEGIQCNEDAKWYSLMKCYKEKRKVCLCEICFYGKKTLISNGMSVTICKRYRTKGTPHYPLESMPVDCSHFSIDKELESMARLNYGNIKVIEKIKKIDT